MDVLLNKFNDLYALLNKKTSLEDTIDFIYNSFKEDIPYDKITVLLLDENEKIYAYNSCCEYTPKVSTGFSVNREDTSINDIIKNKTTRIINDYVQYNKGEKESKLTKLILEEGVKASVTCPLISNDISVGAIIFSSLQPNIYNDDHVEYIRLIANNVAINVEKNLLVDELIISSILGLTKLVEAKDYETGEHLVRMKNYSKILAEKLSKNDQYKNSINQDFINAIFKYSPLHDIGKVGIADGILLKPGKLSIEEFEVMKKHTVIGASILEEVSNNLLKRGKKHYNMGINIAIGHHEKFNGKGYPKGLIGKAISLEARIVTVADVLDALSSKRVYKPAYSLEDSIKMIQEESNKSFDPDVVNALLESKEEISEIYNKFNESSKKVV